MAMDERGDADEAYISYGERIESLMSAAKIDGRTASEKCLSASCLVIDGIKLL
jgi:hypothetical protein